MTLWKKNYADNLGRKERERNGMKEGKKDWKEGKKWRKKEWSYRRKDLLLKEDQRWKGEDKD